jgi:Flp pilus assembly protein TadB
MIPGAGGWLAAVCAAAAAGLAVPLRSRLRTAPPEAEARDSPGGMLRHRPVWCLLAGLGGALFAPGAGGVLVGVAVAVGAWVAIGRAEPPEVRRRREQVRRDLPHLVGLLGATLRGGASPGIGVAVVCEAFPGPAADRLAGVAARLELGVDPGQVWEGLAGDPELAPLGRSLARAHATGASVVRSVERLAEELAQRARADVEERARAVGVKAALPLGLCLLPAFVLIGIVPLVAALLSTLAL